VSAAVGDLTAVRVDVLRLCAVGVAVLAENVGNIEASVVEDVVDTAGGLLPFDGGLAA
jgi:glutamate dehydrogenase/leucine dehydrogenase